MLEVKGFREAEQGVLKMLVNIPLVSQEALEKTADEIVGEAKRLVPVRTGRLRNSIGIEEIRKLSIVIAATAPYAGIVEFGTSRMVARPYMRPAIQKNLTHFVNAFFQRMRI